MRPPLTDAQREVLLFVETFYQLVGRNPSIREICLGEIQGKQIIKSRSSKDSAHGLIKKLVGKGYLIERSWENRTYWALPDDLALGGLNHV